MNKGELCRVLGCTIATLDSYIGAGLPYVEKPTQGAKAWTFDLTEVVPWIIKRERGLREANVDNPFVNAKTRATSAMAGLKEMELAEKRGQMVSVDDVTTALEQEYAVVKTSLRSIPGRVSQLCAVEHDPARIEELLKREVDQVLEELAGA